MRRFHHRALAHWPFRAAAYLILLVALVPTGIGYWRVRQNTELREQARFHAVVEKVQNAVQENLDGLATDLVVVSGLCESSDHVGRDEWNGFVAKLDLERRHPGVRSIGFAEKVTADAISEFLARARKEMEPRYAIFPRPTSSVAFPSVFVTQFPTNIDARPGWDAYSDINRRKALESVLQTHRPAVTGKVQYWNHNGHDTEGLTIFVPVMKKTASTNAEVRGVIFGSLIPQHWFNASFSRRFNEVAVELFDGDTAEPARLLATAGRDPQMPSATRSEMINIRLADRNLMLRVTARPEFGSAWESMLPWIVLGCGLSFSLLVFGIAWMRATARMAADKLDQRLRDSEEQLRSANARLERNISEAATAGEMLPKEKELLGTTLRAIADGVITTDVEGRIVVFNEAAARLTGRDATHAIGRRLSEVFETRVGGTPVDFVRRALEEGVTQAGRDAVLVAGDGVERNISQSIAPIVDAAGRKLGAVLVFRDVTEKMQTEVELQRASKLESIGVLAGGIAHDFNNVLTVILGNISMARILDNTGGAMADALLEAEKASLRARELTQRLLTFARGGAPIKKPIDLAALVRNSVTRSLQGTEVLPEFFIADGLLPVEADESQIAQVVQNLVSHARGSMSQNPRLDIHVLNETASDPLLLLKPGKYLRISIRDYGAGIQSENLTRIFDPYFGGKREGSGLELATAYSIVRKHEGQIRVESISGQGTVFHIYLPAARDTMDPPRLVEGRQRQISFETRRILVMDDELPIRKLAVQLLQRIGCRAVTAADGAEAIELYSKARQEGEPFHAVIMDLTVPNGMGGKEAIPQLKMIDPNVLAIVSSGYSNDPVMANYRDYGFVGVVPKPYNTEDLAAALDELFAGKRDLQGPSLYDSEDRGCPRIKNAVLLP